MLSNQYIAGLFDGEGSVGIYRKSNKCSRRGWCFYLLVQIKLKYGTDVLYEIQKRFGGYVRRRRDGQVCWRCESMLALNFLNAIKDYSRIKQAQILLAIEFQERKHNRVGKDLSDEEFDWQAAVAKTLKWLKRSDWHYVEEEPKQLEEGEEGEED